MTRVVQGGGYKTLESLQRLVAGLREERERKERASQLLALTEAGGQLIGQGHPAQTTMPPMVPQVPGMPGAEPVSTNPMERAVAPDSNQFNVPGYDPNAITSTPQKPLEMYEFIRGMNEKGKELKADPSSILTAINALGPTAQASMTRWTERQQDEEKKQEVQTALRGLMGAANFQEATPFFGKLLELGLTGLSPLMERFKATKNGTSVVRSGGRNVLIDDATGQVIQEYDPITSTEGSGGGSGSGGGGDAPIGRTDLTAMEKWLYGDELTFPDGTIYREKGALGRYPLEEGSMTKEQYQQAYMNVMNDIQLAWKGHPEKVATLQNWVRSSPRSPFSKNPSKYITEPPPAMDTSGQKSGVGGFLEYFFGEGGLLSGKPKTQAEGTGQSLSWDDYQYLRNQGKTDEEIKAEGYAIPKR